MKVHQYKLVTLELDFVILQYRNNTLITYLRRQTYLFIETKHDIKYGSTTCDHLIQIDKEYIIVTHVIKSVDH